MLHCKCATLKEWHIERVTQQKSDKNPIYKSDKLKTCYIASVTHWKSDISKKVTHQKSDKNPI